MTKPARRKTGFTIIEIIIVVVMLGVLAMVAIPRLTAPSEKVIAQEAMEALRSLQLAQASYCLETGTYTNSLANLDIQLGASSNFGAYQVAANGDCSGAADLFVVASMTRTSPNYTLNIAKNGKIKCSGGGGACAGINCNKGGGSDECN